MRTHVPPVELYAVTPSHADRIVVVPEETAALAAVLVEKFKNLVAPDELEKLKRNFDNNLGNERAYSNHCG